MSVGINKPAETTSVTVQVRPHLLKAMSLLVSDDSQRSSLCCVYLDYTKTPVLVATDGKKLGVLCLEEEKDLLQHAKGKGFLIPVSLIKEIPITISKLRHLSPVTLTFTGNTVRLEGWIDRHDVSVEAEAIQKRTSKVDVVRLDGRYVHELQRVANILTLRDDPNKPEYPALLPYDTGFGTAYRVYFKGLPEFFWPADGSRCQRRATKVRGT